MTHLIRLWVMVTADRRKAIALGALLAVGGILWVRAMIVTGGRSSGAARAQRTSTVASEGGASGNKGASETSREQRIVHLPAIAPLERDLFALSDSHFPPSAQTEPSVEQPPKSLTGTDDSLGSEQQVREEASRLRLRSTIVGGAPMAVIEIRGAGRTSEAKVLRPGESVEGFILIEVRRDLVVLEKQGVRVEVGAPAP